MSLFYFFLNDINFVYVGFLFNLVGNLVFIVELLLILGLVGGRDFLFLVGFIGVFLLSFLGFIVCGFFVVEELFNFVNFMSGIFSCMVFFV